MGASHWAVLSPSGNRTVCQVYLFSLLLSCVRAGTFPFPSGSSGSVGQCRGLGGLLSDIQQSLLPDFTSGTILSPYSLLGKIPCSYVGLNMIPACPKIRTLIFELVSGLSVVWMPIGNLLRMRRKQGINYFRVGTPHCHMLHVFKYSFQFAGLFGKMELVSVFLGFGIISSLGELTILHFRPDTWPGPSCSFALHG